MAEWQDADCDDCCSSSSAPNRRCSCFALGAFVAFILLFALSWDTLEPTEYGLVQNGITGYVELNPDNVYSGGRHFIWLRCAACALPRALPTLRPQPSRSPPPTALTPRRPRHSL